MFHCMISLHSPNLRYLNNINDCNAAIDPKLSTLPLFVVKMAENHENESKMKHLWLENRGHS